MTGFFSCDNSIFRLHDFPLASEEKDDVPALAKTNDQTLFSPVIFLPSTSAEALRASDTSPVPSLNLQPNTRFGTAKKIKRSLYRKFVESTYIYRKTKSKITVMLFTSSHPIEHKTTAFSFLSNRTSYVPLTTNTKQEFNRLTPNDPYMGRTAPLTSKRCILYIFNKYRY